MKTKSKKIKKVSYQERFDNIIDVIWKAVGKEANKRKQCSGNYRGVAWYFQDSFKPRSLNDDFCSLKFDGIDITTSLRRLGRIDFTREPSWEIALAKIADIDSWFDKIEKRLNTKLLKIDWSSGKISREK